MIVMSGANESGHSFSTTCHLSPVTRHESTQTFEGSQHLKTTPSWKDSQWSLPGSLFFFLFLFFLSQCQCVCAWMSVCILASLTGVCASDLCVHPYAWTSQGLCVCMFALCAYVCVFLRVCVGVRACVPVQMPPPYYSWLVDGCWLSHLPDFVPARCGGVTGKAPKHSSISTIVQHSLGSGNSLQYPFSRSRCWQKCLHTQKLSGQTYCPALPARVNKKTKDVSGSGIISKSLWRIKV